MTYEEACIKLNQSLMEPFKKELVWTDFQKPLLIWLHGYLTADELEAYAVIMRALQNDADKQCKRTVSKGL